MTNHLQVVGQMLSPVGSTDQVGNDVNVFVGTVVEWTDRLHLMIRR